MPNAPSYFQTDSSTLYGGGPVPNWNDGWYYYPALLATSFPGWESPSYYSWGVYDFGSPKLVHSFTVAYQGYLITGGAVYGSVDGTTWTNVLTLLGADEQVPTTVTHTFADPVCCRYFAVRVNDDGGGSPANAIWDFYVFDPNDLPLFAVLPTVPQAPVPPIGTFTATRNFANSLCSTWTLTWITANATSVTIDQGIGNVALSGTVIVNPSVTTTYTITIYQCSGIPVTYSVTIVIVDNAPTLDLSTVVLSPLSDSVVLTWQPPKNTPSTILLSRATSPNGPFTNIASVGGTETMFFDYASGLEPNTTYYYQFTPYSCYSAGLGTTFSVTTRSVLTYPSATADVNSLDDLPVWMSPSARRAGAAESLLGQITLAIDTANETLYNSITDFVTIDPAAWTGDEDPELAFVSSFPYSFAEPHALAAGTESDPQTVERLLALRDVWNSGYKGSLWASSWAVTAALGRTVRRDVFPYTLGQFATGSSASYPGDTYLPMLEGRDSRLATFDDTNPTTLATRVLLGSTQYLLGDIPLTARGYSQRYGGSTWAVQGRQSPWSRARTQSPFGNTGFLPVPTADNFSAGSAASSQAQALWSVQAEQTSYSIAFARPQYAVQPDGSVNTTPGFIPRDRNWEGLQSAKRAVFHTPADARLRGDTDFRVAGDSIPTATWQGITGNKIRPSWADSSQMRPGISGLPFDLDQTTTIFTAPGAAGSTVPYGFGTGSTNSLHYDHPLATDYA